jgi:hemoglobin
VKARQNQAVDLDSRVKIALLIDTFYARVLRDERLAPIFLDVAQIDLDVHLPLIRSYWEKLLLGDKSYQRHTMNIHRAVHARRVLQPEDFERWLSLFSDTVDELYCGPGAQRALQLASHIAANMEAAMSPIPA